MPTKTRSSDIKITRIYDAPLETVWDAWTDPEQVAKWWGPRGFTLTTHSKDLRVGGHWAYTMHGPDGVNYENKTLYHEVEPGKKLVYDHGGNDDRPPLFRVTVFFSEQGGKTKMDMTMTLPTPEAAEEARKFIKKAGGDSTWDRLAEYLEKESSGKERFVINRSFDAPLAVMFEMWTSPEHFAKWLPPTGFDMQFLRCDIKPGGSSFYCMSGTGFNASIKSRVEPQPSGSSESAPLETLKMYGRAEYLEVAPPDRIVYTQQFCDEHENLSRHPKMPTWPATMLTTVKLAEEGPDRTRVTVTWEPYGPTTREELESFIQAKGGMTQGWTGSFDKLEGLLASR